MWLAFQTHAADRWAFTFLLCLSLHIWSQLVGEAAERGRERESETDRGRRREKERRETVIRKEKECKRQTPRVEKTEESDAEREQE